MKFSIITEQPIILSVACLIFAAGLTIFLYRKDKRFAGLSKIRLYFLATIRFVSIFLLAFFLLGPLIKSLKQYIEKPLLIVAQDNSSSILLGADSLFMKDEYAKVLTKSFEKLSDKFNIHTLAFGSSTRDVDSFDFKDDITDFSDLLNDLENNYSNRNVGALIIASDGIYNRGANPTYQLNNFNFPIYTVALGDTTIRKDLIIKQIRHNAIAFLGNTFPLSIHIEANELQAEKSELKIKKGDNLIHSEEINITSNSFSKEIEIEIEAKSTGLQRYTIELSQIEGETNLINNRKDVIIDIIDSKQKILILSNSPHPDNGALNKSLELNKNFETEYFVIDDFKGKVTDYNLVILNQLPSKRNSIVQVLSDISKNNIPTLFILGTSSAVNNINSLGLGLSIELPSTTAFEESEPILNNNFTLFSLPADLSEFITKVPPLITPFANYKTSLSSEVLFKQKIKSIETDKPLLVFNSTEETKVGFICGEGLWRWRMYNYMLYENHDIFNQLINRIIQYLALKVKKERFVIDVKKIFNEKEAIQFAAELYNESFELINNEDINLEIRNLDNKEYRFVFSKTEKAYSLNSGLFPVGDYSYVAGVKYKNEYFEKKGNFSVVAVNTEAVKTTANHQLLNRLAENSNARMYFPNQLDNLAEELLQNNNIVSVSYSEKKLIDLINLKIIFIIILIMLSTEWFFRKYWGSY